MYKPCLHTDKRFSRGQTRSLLKNKRKNIFFLFKAFLDRPLVEVGSYNVSFSNKIDFGVTI